jgi:hypothetical protein
MAYSHKSYVPNGDADFDVWGNNLCAIAVRNTMGEKPKWPHIPTAAVEKMVLMFKLWHEAYLLTLQPHPPALTVAKDKARTVAEAVIRPFVGQWLMWEPVTDEDREEAGVHNKKPRRPAVPAPTTVPLLEPRAGTPRQVIVPYHDKGSVHRGKPEDVHGIEVRWALLGLPPVHIEMELTNSAFDTRSPLILNFDEADRGKRIYMAGRWEIEREGIKGNFGDIESVIIP